MAIFSTELERARAGVENLRAARETLETKAQAAIEALDRLRAESPERELAELLDGVDGGVERAKIITLDGQVQGMIGARRLLVAQLSAGLQAVNRAEAADLRAKADKAEADLQRHLTERDKKLKALQEHEESFWCPLIRAETAEAAALGEGALIVGGAFHRTVPKSDRLAAELNQMRQQADAIERRKIRSDGEAEASEVDELLQALNIPGSITPLPSVVRRWAEAGESKALNELRQSLRGPEPVWRFYYRLRWQAGLILESASRVSLIVVDPEAVQSIAEARQRQLARAAA